MYEDWFSVVDELIRQVTISCQERGLLLLRVRDEIRMSIAAYQTLYESSVAFGMRKALQAEQGKSDMETKIKELEEEKRNLEQQVLELKAKCEAIEKRENERRSIEEKKHAEEIAFLKKTNVQLKVCLSWSEEVSCLFECRPNWKGFCRLKRSRMGEPWMNNKCDLSVTCKVFAHLRYTACSRLEFLNHFQV